MKDASKQHLNIGEFDDYPIPEPDLTLTPEERERGLQETERLIKETYQTIMKRHESIN